MRRSRGGPSNFSEQTPQLFRYQQQKGIARTISAGSSAHLDTPDLLISVGSLRNPGEVLFDALDRSDLDVRTSEGLPWLVLEYPHLDWTWLLRELKLRNRQNRLGFVVSLAVDVARRRERNDLVQRLERELRELEDARLAKEDTLCQESWTPSRKKHVRRVRSRLAAHWNLDTRLSLEDLAHYAE